LDKNYLISRLVKNVNLDTGEVGNHKTEPRDDIKLPLVIHYLASDCTNIEQFCMSSNISYYLTT